MCFKNYSTIEFLLCLVLMTLDSWLKFFYSIIAVLVLVFTFHSKIRFFVCSSGHYLYSLVTIYNLANVLFNNIVNFFKINFTNIILTNIYIFKFKMAWFYKRLWFWLSLCSFDWWSESHWEHSLYWGAIKFNVLATLT